MASAQDVLSVARGEIGYSRWADPETGTKYGRWYAGQTGEPYYGESGVPYCAMFASYVFAHAGASCAGLPAAYCPYIVRDAKAAGKAVRKYDAQPGDLVLFDWGGDGVADHVGIVEQNNGTYLTTIEGNTSSGQSGSQSNGGGVYRRVRSFGVVCCVVRPDYGGSRPVEDGIECDGVWGRATTRRLQEVLGTTADGEVWHQWPANRGLLPACCSGWQYDSSGAGSPVIAAAQKAMGIDADGLMGPATVNALIDRYKAESGATVLDGRLDLPSITVKTMQATLNQGRF